jgi:PAS domain S-box-containing protein
MIILDLIQNIALLVALAAIYQVLGYRIRQNNLRFQILSGLLFGVVGVVGMLTPLHLMPGIIFDGRSVILSVSGLFGGPVVALIAALICAGYRLWLGGAGAWVGAAVALESAALGVLFYYLRRRKAGSLSALALWGFGLLVHLIMLALMLALPGGAGRAVLQQVGLPILVVYPVATMLVCLLFQDYETKLADHQALQQSEEQYRLLAEYATDVIWILDLQTGRFRYVSPSVERLRGYTAEEVLAQDMTAALTPASLQYLQAILPERVQKFQQGHTEFYTDEIEQPRKDGSTVWTEVTTRYLLNQATGHLEAIGVTRDISERQQAEQELQRRADEMTALREIMLDLTSQRDLSTLLRLIVERAVRLLGADSGGLYLCDFGRQEVTCVVSYNTPRDYTRTVMKYGEGAAGVVAQTGEALIIDDYRVWPGRAKVFDEEQPFSAVLAAPMVWQKQILGVIHVLHSEAGRRFTFRERDLLTLFANQAAVAVQSARLFSTAEQEIAERKRAETALRETTQTLQAVVQASPLPILALNRDGSIQMWNPAAERIFGWSEQEVLGRQNPAVTEEKKDESRAMFLQVLAGNGFTGVETLRQKKDGSLLDVSISTAPLDDDQGNIRGVMAVIADITERKRAEQKIVTALKEKEILLRELYHRTKNNMQVILSMLSLESARTRNDEIKAAYKEIANRIQAMALVHQKLYQSQSLSQINLQDYLQELAELLLHSFRLAPGKIALRCAIQPVEVLIDTAMPCGLVVTELISNSLKYAFPGEMSGEISLQLSRKGQEIELCCSDNGVGVPPDFDFRGQKTYGLQSIFALVEHQLQGQVSFATGKGLACHIRFSDTLYAPRVEA